MAKVSVIGSGTWGTALAVLLFSNGHEVILWSALEEEVKEISQRRSHRNLPGVKIPEGILVTGDLEEACKERDVLVLSVPSV